jgi:hypothetical protein
MINFDDHQYFIGPFNIPIRNGGHVYVVEEHQCWVLLKLPAIYSMRPLEHEPYMG